MRQSLLVIGWLVRDFYFSRLHAIWSLAGLSVECLAEKDCKYPVRETIPIASGAQYNFGLVVFDGISEPHSAALAAKWNPGSDGPFDHTFYVSNFISC